MAARRAKTTPERGDLSLRLLTALVLLPPLFLLVWGGGLWFTFLALAAALLGVVEFYRLGTPRGVHPKLPLGLLWTALLIFNAHYPPQDTLFLLPLILGATLLLYLAWALAVEERRTALVNWTFTVAGPGYLGIALAHGVMLRQLEKGLGWILLVLLTTFATDTCAYFIGRALGRHPMAPRISPGKTWEGTIAGLLGAVGSAMLLSFFFDLPLSSWQALLLGAVVGAVAQLGDLGESLFKRVAQVKDTGRLLPGHGGLLDRLDSLVLTLIVVYHGVRWLVL